jgi:two-component system sensor histidine kinase RegB
MAQHLKELGRVLPRLGLPRLAREGDVKQVRAAPSLGPSRRPIGRVRLRTLVLVRWIALTGQALALLFVHYSLDLALPLGVALAAIGVSAAFNLFLFVGYPSATRLSDSGAALHLGFDLGQLAILLYLTGGLQNPFAVLILVPVTISATNLSRRSTVLLGLAATAIVSALGVVYRPLPWPDAGLELPGLYVLGIWVALVLGMGFIAAYAFQVAEEGRRMSDALAASGMSLARERQLSALGGMAAAAAHELGTPLGTIAVAAADLVKTLDPGTTAAQDAALIADQAKRCRQILIELAGRTETSEVFAALPLPGLLEIAANTHRRQDVELEIAADNKGAPPLVRRSPEILHGLGALIENAFDFARTKVVLAYGWDERAVRVRVIDDGPGFNIDILSALGEPYTTSRANEGMGLGVFIAKTLLSHTGAEVRFANRAGGGAEALILWPRHEVEMNAKSGA